MVTQEWLRALKSRRDDILVLMVAAASNKRGVFHIRNLVYRPYGTIDLGWLLVTNIPSLRDYVGSQGMCMSNLTNHILSMCDTDRSLHIATQVNPQSRRWG